MGCMNGKMLSEKIIKRPTDDENRSEDIRWVVIPPSEVASEISNFSTMLKVSPEKLFRRTEVQNCFAYATDQQMPQNWTYTEQGFQIFNVLEQNFVLKRPEAHDIRKTTARPSNNIYQGIETS